MTANWTRLTVDVSGVVQGVGFRPTIKRLADEAGLGGWIQNRSGSVTMELVGPSGRVREFLHTLPRRIPPMAQLDQIVIRGEASVDTPSAEGKFDIIESARSDENRVVIPADLAMCPDCRREVFDSANRRFGYPFTTCTNCGPRYTVVNAMPYDRVRTTMSAFPLCDECAREYDDPGDRRFHAESIACPVCGPRLRLLAPSGEVVSGDPLRTARAALAQGKIVAVRGIGGYLLAADATNSPTLAVLRERKRRSAKPLAIMARNLAVVRRTVRTTAAAEDLLRSAVAPIVILPFRDDTAAGLPWEMISPDTRNLGVMLPTSPLHSLLFEQLPGDKTPPFDWLVMTSGNRRSEPICISNDEALERMRDIADLFLTHDREINLRSDDSVFTSGSGGTQVWRRARGLAPGAIRLHRPLGRTVLAMGAELKNAIAIGFEDRVVGSPHVGDLETPEAVDALSHLARELPAFLHREPEVVAVDLHPDMHATRIGEERARELGIEMVRVQHHHAHAAGALAEHGLDAGLALVFDGTGHGTDGLIWGAELLAVEKHRFTRLATFAPVPLPGGDTAVVRPARQVVGRATALGIPIDDDTCRRLGVTPLELETWTTQCRAGINTPMTHAAGRLFDTFSALLGIAPSSTTYEGQAAIRLETAARAWDHHGVLPGMAFETRETDDMLLVDWSGAIACLLDPAHRHDDVSRCAFAFHRAVAEACVKMAEFGRAKTGHTCVALTGGVFMNGLLANLARTNLSRDGFMVLTHRDVPPNDGGIAFGQAVVAGSTSVEGR
ncbi:MAG: carbamoyltransferase HypF [Deltaproteobacteria bacterium]|nr:carbamoyltransferase HypF [Deltaproteobacteria bacterium]